MTLAKWAYGSQLLKNGTVIAALTNIGSPDLDTDEIDVTAHDSPDGFEEVLAGIKRTGVVSLEGFFVPGDAGQAALLADYITGATDSYVVKFPTSMAAQWAFTGFVKKGPVTGAPVDGAVPFSAEVRITGKPALQITQSGNLSALTATVGTLVPAFSATKYAYVFNVLTGVTFVNVTPTAGAGVITVDGAVVLSGTPSANIAIGAAGTITRVTVKVTETGKMPTTYTIDVARP